MENASLKGDNLLSDESWLFFGLRTQVNRNMFIIYLFTPADMGKRKPVELIAIDFGSKSRVCAATAVTLQCHLILNDNKKRATKDTTDDTN